MISKILISSIAKRGGIPEDKDNFILLIKDLKAAFQPHGYLLTAAIGAAVPTIDTSYDVPLMYKYLDLVHVMCYDYHGKWDKKTGHNAPLYSRPQDTGKDVFLNVEATVKHLLKKVSRCASRTWQFNIFYNQTTTRSY